MSRLGEKQSPISIKSRGRHVAKIVAAVWLGFAAATLAGSNSWISVSGPSANLMLNWSNTDATVDAHLIERSTDQINFIPIARMSAGATNYQDTGLLPSTTYFYRLRSHNATGFSNYSNIGSNTTSAVLGSPTLFDGYWDESNHWSLGHPPSTADPTNSIANTSSKTVLVDAFTASAFPSTLRVNVLTLSAPAGSTNTLYLADMPLASLEVLTGFVISTGGALKINNSVLQVGTALSIDGSATLLAGSIITTNASLIVGNQSAGSLSMSDGTLNARDITVAARPTATGTFTIDGGALTANSLTVTNPTGRLVFNAGSLTSAGTTVSNSLPFAAGNGTNAATYRLLGGVHTFATGLRVRTNATLTGCGTINGPVVIDSRGFVLADCGSRLTFTGIVTNNGTMRAVNGSVFASANAVVNNGLLIFISGGTNFQSFINNGIVLDPGSTNDSWFSATNGKWEAPANWSRGVIPFDELSVSITNANGKTVTLDAATTNFISSLTINSLTVSSPGGSTNSLALNNLGVLNPLTIFDKVILDAKGAVLINNSSLRTMYTAPLDVIVGQTGGAANLTITNGGALNNNSSYLGYNSTSSNNTVLVTDNGSAWYQFSDLVIGNSGSSNSLVIRNGGAANNNSGYLGYNSSSSNNTVLITDPGSTWYESSNLAIGYSGSGNSLAIRNGGVAYNGASYLGYNSSSRNNTALISDSASLWSVNRLVVGASQFSTGNSVIITNGGVVYVAGDLLIGNASSSNSVTLTDGGTLLIGTTLSIGPSNNLSFRSGFLSSAGTAVTNGLPFVVGDGTNPATFNLNGGVHAFATGLEIRPNALLAGCGTINGSVLVSGSGAVTGDCGDTLNFTGPVTITNTASVTALAGTFVNFFGPVINKGTIDATAGNVHFYSTYQGTGTLLANNPNTLFSTLTTNYWTRAAGGKWEASTNWSGGTPVSVQPALLLTNAPTKTVTLDPLTAGDPIALTISNLIVSAPLGSTNTLLLDNAGLSSSLTILNTLLTTTNGTVTINNSSLLASRVVINAGSQITVADGDFHVSDYSGTGALDIRNGRFTFNGGSVTMDQLILTGGPNSLIAFNRGILASGGTTVTNTRPFIVGDGINSASFGLAGGVHSFANGLVITNNAELTGCGTINGTVVIRPGGILIANCGGTLSFTGSVTNNGTLLAVNGTFLHFYGPVINNAWLDTTGGNVRFWNGLPGTGGVQLDPAGDADGDGVPNGWTQQYFGHPLGDPADKSRAQDDAFGTGQNNLFKFVAGLNPTNRTAIFLLRVENVTGQPNQKKLHFQPVTDGRTYTLEYCTNLATGAYLPLTDFTGPQTNATEVILTDISAAGANRFYRVRITYP